MKKLILLSLIIISFIACKEEPKDYVTVTGQVQNLSTDIDSILIFIPNGYEKKIPIDDKGSFSDTLKVTEGKYQFKIGDEYGTIYLKNDDEVKIITDYEDFDQQLKFEGNNTSADISNVYIDYFKLSTEYLNQETLLLPQEKLDSVLADYNTAYEGFKKENNKIQPSIWKELDTDYHNNIDGFKKYYAQSQEIKNKYEGKTSPGFAMQDIDGNTVKLSDFTGKYVYVDVWATWCGPCKREIPYLKEIEEKYQDKDIVFVSMSVDKVSDKDKWSKFVKEKDLQGVQIFADNSWDSEFVQAYEIQSIPRFLLIGPDGKIVSPDAPRPSNPALEKLFEDLNI